MSLFKQFMPQQSDPTPTGQPFQGKPYATSPLPERTSEGEMEPKALAPQFSNFITLKTLDSNLLLQFGFIESAQSKIQTSQLTAVVLGSDTAKQLFCALAELFDCEIRPNP